MRRYLYLAHRWLGIALCAFMAMWFVSGVVMMYVGYPKLTPAERLAAAAPLALPVGAAPLSTIFAAPGRSTAPREIVLATVGGQPRWILDYGKAGRVAVDAVSGAPVSPTGPQHAALSASAWARGATVDYVDSVDEDAWTHSRALDAHRPLHRVDVRDEAGTRLYVSSRTGEVVRDATRIERTWNWMGAWIHWLYPFRGGSIDAAWHDIVVWVSVAGTLLAATGLVVGVWRWRFGRPYSSGARSPYHDRSRRWHHVAGLIFGAVATTWIASGLFSMNPWRMFTSPAPPLDTAAFTGGDLTAAAWVLSPTDAIHHLVSLGFEVRELELRRFDGKGWYVAYNGSGASRILAATPDARPVERLDPVVVAHAGARLVPNARVVRTMVLDGYDAYWYARASHTMTGHVERRLPVVRLGFDDPYGTWVHLDPATASVAGRLDRLGRVKRWAFAFLHSVDWWPLVSRRPAWDLLLIALSIGGAAISVTGVVIGWRRLRGTVPVVRRVVPPLSATGVSGTTR